MNDRTNIYINTDHFKIQKQIHLNNKFRVNGELLPQPSVWGYLLGENAEIAPEDDFSVMTPVRKLGRK